MLAARSTGACTRPRAAGAAPARPIVAGARRPALIARAAAAAEKTAPSITLPSLPAVLDIEAIKGILPHR
jgi:hypothetical protein